MSILFSYVQYKFSASLIKNGDSKGKIGELLSFFLFLNIFIVFEVTPLSKIYISLNERELLF